MHNNMNVNVSGPVQAPAMQSYQTIVLKYNIVDGHNLLTQEMMSQEDTIYVIKWDFELAENITIPANCVLQFDGGSISGGTIDFNKCVIKASKENYIFKNLTDFANLIECSIKWFGAKGDGITDDTDIFKFVLNRNHYQSSGNNVKGLEVIVPFGVYIITDCINPLAYTGDAYQSVSLIGEAKGTWISRYSMVSEMANINRAVLYCQGNLDTAPYMYAINLIKNISFRGEDNGDKTNVRTFLPKYYDTIGVKVSKQNNGYSTYNTLEDVQIQFFGTGLEINNCNWFTARTIDISNGGYGIKFINLTQNIPNGIFYDIDVFKFKYDALYIECDVVSGMLRRPYVCFYNACFEHSDCLNDPTAEGYDESEKYYNIRSNAPIYIIDGHIENAYNSKDVVNVLLTGGNNAGISTFELCKMQAGIFDFGHIVNVNRPISASNTTFKMNHLPSVVRGVNLRKIIDYEKTRLENVSEDLDNTTQSGFSPLDKQFINLPTNERPWWDRAIGGSFYYDTDLKQLVYWNGTNWSDLDGVNINGATITSVIGDTQGRLALTLTANNKGFKYYDTDLQMWAVWNGTRWIDNNGYTAGLHKGASIKRPVISSYGGILVPNTDSGYSYFDTDLEKPLYWDGKSSGSLWRYFDGTPATCFVSFNSLSHADSSYCGQPNIGGSWSTIIIPRTGYHLPQSITVTINGQGTLQPSNGDYTWNPSTGELTVYGKTDGEGRLGVTNLLVLYITGEADA